MSLLTYRANTEECLSRIEEIHFEFSSRNVAFEILQLVQLLKVLRGTNFLEYPLIVKHTGENSVPDFQLISGKKRIAIEVSRATTSSLEWARALQGRGQLRTLSLSEVLRDRDRSRPELINEISLNRQFVNPVTIKERREISLNSIFSEIRDKTQVFHRGSFARQAENWLVIVDQIGVPNSELPRWREEIAAFLRSYWGSDWYSAVFLQQRQFEWTQAFTEAEVRRLS